MINKLIIVFLFSIYNMLIICKLSTLSLNFAISQNHLTIDKVIDKPG